MKSKGFTIIELIVLLAMIVLFLLFLFGASFILSGFAHLIAGWFFYLSRTLPLVEIKWSGVITFLIAFLLLIILLHSFLRWLAQQRHSESETRIWRWQWTIKILLIVLLAFAGGICATGMVHQVGWLASSKERLLGGGLRDAADKMLSGSNLRQLMIAMHNYHQDHNELPPVFTVNASQKPLHSWRVLILPYIEEGELYQKFKLNEPWDSPHNMAVLQNNPIPKLYKHPNKRDDDDKKTYYRAFYSKPGATLFAGLTSGKSITLKTIAEEDGTANTAALFEGEPVVWTKPEDVEFDEQLPLPKFNRHWPPSVFQVVMFDFSTHSIRVNAPESAIKALITRNGKEKVDFNEFE